MTIVKRELYFLFYAIYSNVNFKKLTYVTSRHINMESQIQVELIFITVKNNIFRFLSIIPTS